MSSKETPAGPGGWLHPGWWVPAAVGLVTAAAHIATADGYGYFRDELSVLFLGFGIVAGLIAARRWAPFRDRHLWLGGALAAALFAPHLAWQIVHDWPTVEFMTNAAQSKNAPLGPHEFLAAQLSLMNPVVAPVAVAGLWFYLGSAAGARWRSLGWAFIAVVVVMMVQNSKPYYLSPMYTMLFAGGAVAVSGLCRRPRLTWIPGVAIGVVAASGLALAPTAKPVLDVDGYLAYARALGIEASTDERKEVGRLPQFFADRFGWPELARTVGEVADSLPAQDRAGLCVFAENYGQAGAVDFFLGPAGPPAISGHNSYHLWGHDRCTGDVVIVIGGELDQIAQVFDAVDRAAVHTCGDCMPYENHKPIWVARRLETSWPALWPRLRHFD